MEYVFHDSKFFRSGGSFKKVLADALRSINLYMFERERSGSIERLFPDTGFIRTERPRYMFFVGSMPWIHAGFVESLVWQYDTFMIEFVNPVTGEKTSARLDGMYRTVLVQDSILYCSGCRADSRTSRILSRIRMIVDSVSGAGGAGGKNYVVSPVQSIVCYTPLLGGGVSGIRVFDDEVWFSYGDVSYRLSARYFSSSFLKKILSAVGYSELVRLVRSTEKRIGVLVSVLD